MTEPPALMHATLVARPFHTPGWVYEEKYDGWRMLALKEEGIVRLISRNGRDHTKRFADLVAALTELRPKTFTLDGEVAVFDQELLSRFEWLRHINHGDLATPPLFMAFDLLQLGPRDYGKEPLKVRRRTLERLLKAQTLILPARRLMRPRALGGSATPRVGSYVAKDPESPYVAGRTLKWLKVKQKEYRVKERGFYDPEHL